MTADPTTHRSQHVARPGSASRCALLVGVVLAWVQPAPARAAEATEPANAASATTAPLPVESDDRRALRALGRSLPRHGLLPLESPSLDADDAAWVKYAKKLVQTFAPESMKRDAKAALLEQRPLSGAIEPLVPRHRRYKALQALLEVYARQMGASTEPIPAAWYKVKAGITAPEVALLRDRLRVEGYGDEGVQGRLREYFDDRLKRALQAWQKDHGLARTSSLDPQTLTQLNAPITLPVADVALALQRFRALDLRRDDGRQLLVHINAFALVAERNGSPELAMPVVVGKNTEKDRTPRMSTRLETVIANPSWAVPQRIVEEKLRPGAKDIPEMLIDKGYEVTVDATGKWRVRMGPGPDNPLGKLKFLLDGTNGVYLHDTNTRSAFAKDERSLSHGCVRVSDPMGLARWVLPGRELDLEEAVTYTSLSTSFGAGDLPTHLMYQTALVEDGRLVRFPDVYGLDPAELANFDAHALARAVRALGN
ncbi:MAG: L,D-transpeptidase family protein [Deltaproteobacteria bacterium]|nr:L,D-transpeptidase family protein [Deltaproteobacteria bacterium]